MCSLPIALGSWLNHADNPHGMKVSGCPFIQGELLNAFESEEVLSRVMLLMRSRA